MKQRRLIPKTSEERIAELEEALKKYGKHTLFCSWTGQFYDKGCTCGLKEVIDFEDV